MNLTKIDLDHLRRTADSLAGTEYSGLGAAMKMAADEIGSLRDQVQNLTRANNQDKRHLSPEKLQEIADRQAAKTPGPYYWTGWLENKQLMLQAPPGGQYIMGFTRWGMRGAQPIFRGRNGSMVKVEDLLIRKHESSGEIISIDSPDAVGIAKSWQDIQHLLDHIQHLQEQIERKERMNFLRAVWFVTKAGKVDAWEAMEWIGEIATELFEPDMPEFMRKIHHEWKSWHDSEDESTPVPVLERILQIADSHFERQIKKRDAIIASMRRSMGIRGEYQTELEQKVFDLEGELDALDPSRECLHCENVYVPGPFEDDDEPAYCSDVCRDKGPREEVSA